MKEAILIDNTTNQHRKKDRHRGGYIPFRCSEETAKQIEELAKRQSISKAEVVRELVNRGLNSMQIEDDRMRELVKVAAAEALAPSVERLAAISAKATQIGSAAFFLSIWAATKDGSVEERAAIEEAAAAARQLGIQYLKLAKDKDLDVFIRDGAKKILED